MWRLAQEMEITSSVHLPGRAASVSEIMQMADPFVGCPLHRGPPAGQ